MEKWEIRPTPTPADPDRHLLLMQGGPSDVSALLRKFGATLGRPSPSKVDGFNLSLVIHKLKPAVRTKLDGWLRKVAPPKDIELQAPEPEAAVPAPSSPKAAPAAPAVVASPPPAPAAPVPMAPPPVPVPGAPAPAPVAAAAPAAAPVALSISVEPREEWTFESLLVGAYNRFAHAAAMSVVSSPGSMYNPLFLYGVAGTGKTHMVHAIGAALSKSLGDEPLLLTSGSRLSRAVDAAIAAKTMNEIDARVAGAKALLIDDIHLMAVSDQNKDALAKIFKSFFDRKLQVVIISLFPPRALGALEEALKFSFSKGWSVDLKVPGPSVQKDLISSAAGRSGAGLGEDEVVLLHEKLSQAGYQDLSLWLKRVAALKAAREAAGQPAALADLLPLIYDPVVAPGAEAAKPSFGPFTPPAAPANAEPIAVIAPMGEEGLGPFAAARFYEEGGKNGFPQIYRHALWETYDPGQPFGLPFQIGEMCRRAGVTRALIVGPGPETPLGPRSAEFAHAVRRILESYGIEMAWIPYAGLQTPAHYLNAHLDLARLSGRA